jgi:hypothetical protein
MVDDNDDMNNNKSPKSLDTFIEGANETDDNDIMTNRG